MRVLIILHHKMQYVVNVVAENDMEVVESFRLQILFLISEGYVSKSDKTTH